MAHKILEEIIGKKYYKVPRSGRADTGNAGRKNRDQHRLCLKSGAGSEENEGRDALCHSKGPQCKC